jgi:kynurenine formamidase
MGWARRFADHSDYRDHPWLEPAAADWLVDKEVRLLAIDTPTPDLPIGRRGPGFAYPIHRRLLDAGILIIENLASLEGLTMRRERLVALPLNIVGADGAPARVMIELGA